MWLVQKYIYMSKYTHITKNIRKLSSARWFVTNKKIYIYACAYLQMLALARQRSQATLLQILSIHTYKYRGDHKRAKNCLYIQTHSIISSMISLYFYNTVRMLSYSILLKPFCKTHRGEQRNTKIIYSY